MTGRWAALGFCALAACGIGVVGSADPDAGVDAGAVEASAPTDAAADTDAAGPDAATVQACLVLCPAPAKCDAAGTCVFTCDHTGACNTVTCPDNVPCRVACTANQACQDVKCGKNSTCEVVCKADAACKDVVCTGRETDSPPVSVRQCTIDCEGNKACDEVSAKADNSHITCNGPMACAQVRCGDGNCLLDGMPIPMDSKCCRTNVCTGFKDHGTDCF